MMFTGLGKETLAGIVKESLQSHTTSRISWLKILKNAKGKNVGRVFFSVDSQHEADALMDQNPLYIDGAKCELEWPNPNKHLGL